MKIVYIFAIPLLLMGNKVYSNDIYLAEITGETVNIRIKPSGKSEVVCRAKRGEMYQFFGTEGNWYKIGMVKS